MKLWRDLTDPTSQHERRRRGEQSGLREREREREGERDREGERGREREI